MSELLTSRRFLGYLAWSLLALLAVGAICLCLGPGAMFVLSPGVLHLRLARVLTAALVGAALSAAGVTLQALMRNPLASPSILGISTGASAGVIFGMFLQTRWPSADLAFVPPSVMALIFGLLTMVIVYLLAQRRGQLDPLSLLLVGVMISAFNGALIMVLNLLVPHGLMADIMVWMMGKVGESADWTLLGYVSAGIVAGILILLSLTQKFNLQALGESTARSLGVRVGPVRVVSFAVASLITAAAVAISGPIGFVGLICPHICRSLFGPDHRVLMVTSVAFGAIFLLLGDTAVRSLANVTGGEIPVGVITAMCGGPFFIYLLRRHLRRKDLA